jgi:hypothetical protein
MEREVLRPWMKMLDLLSEQFFLLQVKVLCLLTGW